MNKIKFFLILVLFFAVVNSISANELTAYAITNNINVRKEASKSSKVVGQIKIADVLTITKIRDQIVTINGVQGRWVYVDSVGYRDDTGGPPNIQGWVFDYYIGYLQNFQRIQGCNFQKVNAGASGSEYHVEFSFTKDCKYIKYNSEPNFDTGIMSKPMEVSRGNLFMLKNVVIAKSSKGKIDGVFYINSLNELKFNSMY